MKHITNTLIYAIGYLLLMVPTYVLPYMGSNSAIINAVSSAVGWGPTPQWWMHAWCLVMLVLLAWMRGHVTSRKYIPIFSVVAAVFDLTPGLSMVPLVPTIMHLLALILGATAAVQTNYAAAPGRIPKVIGGIAVAFTAATVGGISVFTATKPLASVSTAPSIKVNETKALKAPDPLPPKDVVVAKTKPTKPVTPKPAPERKPPVSPKPEEVRYIRLND